MLDELSNEERRGRIVGLIKEIGKPKNAIAEEVGVSAQAVTGWETTGRIGRKPSAMLCAMAGKPVEYLTVRDWKSAASEDVRDQEWAEILGYKTAAALGDGTVPDEYAETHKLKFRAQSLMRKRLRPEKLGVCYGRGDSMLPRIKSGDAILFDMSDTTPRDGALFVVTYDGHLMAKQLTELGGRWFIESLNKDDPKWRKPVPIDEFKGFEIHGRVRWIGSWED